MQMITKNLDDFIYTLEDDEKRCLASLEKVEQQFREKSKKIPVHEWIGSKALIGNGSLV